MKIETATIDRFWRKVNKGNIDECWEWQASISSSGYGQIAINKSPRLAHRVSFCIANGYLPNVCRHTCDNKKCVNPKHLVNGDAKDNAMDAVARGFNWQTNKTHCASGHEYAGDNLYVNSRGHRWCRACHRVSSERYRNKKK